jgi:hypothetical protein
MTSTALCTSWLGRAGTGISLYIGQSSEGDERLRPSRHAKMPAARSLGLTDVHVHLAENRMRRFSIETNLRQRHATPLNQQPTPAAALELADIGGVFGYGGGFAGGGVNAFASMNSLTPRTGLEEPPTNALRSLGIGGIGCTFGLDALVRGLNKRSRRQNALEGRNASGIDSDLLL